MTLRKIKKHKIIIAGLGAVVTVIVVAIVFVVFGIDQKIIKTPLEGIVISSDGKAIEGAEVSIQSYNSSTDSLGKFSFEDINFGTYEISVSKNGFSPYRERIKINRFANTIEIALKSEEFGEMLLKFESDSLAEDLIEVKINNMLFPVTKTENGFELKTGRLLTGSYLLEIVSPDYVDNQTRLEVSSGTVEKTIRLFPAADLVTELEDYVSLEKVVPETVSINISGSKRQVSKDELTENRLEFKDLDVAKEVEIEIEHPGYLKKNIKIDLEQGLNSLDKTRLVPEGRHLITQGKTVRSVQVDGTLPKTIFEGNNNCTMIGDKGNIYLAKCGSTVVAITIENGDYRLLREYYWNFNSGDFLVGENSLVTIGHDTHDIVLIHSTSNNSVIYTHGKDVLSVIGDSSGNIYFSDEEAVYKLDRLGISSSAALSSSSSESSTSPSTSTSLVPISAHSTAKEIIKGRYFLQSVSPNKNLILALSQNSSDQNNMWVIDLNSNQSRKLNFLPGDFSQLKFIKNNLLAYLDNKNLYIKQLDSQHQEEILKGVNNYWLDFTGQIYFAHKEKGSGIVFATQQNRLEKPLQMAE